jgi:predicted metalloprotease with PDZ domain
MNEMPMRRRPMRQGSQPTELPKPLPRPDNVPEPKDRPYPGTIELHVDATDVIRRIFSVRQSIPVSGGGRFTLVYPEWLPGFHAPKAQIELLSALTISAAGQKLSWRRDPVNVYAFHVQVPEGISTLDVRFQYLAPTDGSQGRVTVTREMLDLQWNTVVLHPAGYYARNITVRASAEFPPGWGHACAIPSKTVATAAHFDAVPLDVLVDSPVYAGRHSSRIPLGDGVHLNLFSDKPEQLGISQGQLGACKALVREATAMFGARHYDQYEFLVALSDEVGGNGIEHHRCCEIATSSDLLLDWEKNLSARDVLGHEYVHSWNGKYRRGADSWQPCFLEPIRNSLMWVYEGLTQYLGQVLCARAGIWTAQDLVASLATTAGDQLTRRGRIWRSMADTTHDPVVAGRAALPWKSWQRSEDYYADGQLMWLEVDMMIREATEGLHSLDDFAKVFFGMKDGEWITNTYDFDDVCSALNEVLEYPWADFLNQRLYTLASEPPLGGFERGGYRLKFREEENHFAASKAAVSNVTDLAHSIGLKVRHDGRVSECIWGSPAFDAGITAGAKLLGVNGQEFSADGLKLGVARTSEGRFLNLLVKHDHHLFECQLTYTGGHRHPHLIAMAGKPLLNTVAVPRAPDEV